jgi:hypothetical protein
MASSTICKRSIASMASPNSASLHWILDIGGRKTLDRAGHLRLLFMEGRAIQHVTRANGEPSWIAYIGAQLLLGPKKDAAAPAGMK